MHEKSGLEQDIMTSNRNIENTLSVMSYVTRAAKVLTDLYEEMQFCVMISGMWTSCVLKNNNKKR